MGQISARLLKRLGKARKLTQELRREAGPVRDALDALKHGVTSRLSHGVALDPLHAVYVAAQNLTSVFAERVSEFPEFDPYYRAALHAQDTYLPGGPPMSPLTGSYFTSWAFFDLRFGPDRETIGTCLLDVGGPLGIGSEVIEVIRLMSETRMGVYEHAGAGGDRCLLRELITGDEFECYVPAGYPGEAGELWYVRLCPPVEPVAYHVAFTTPYWPLRNEGYPSSTCRPAWAKKDRINSGFCRRRPTARWNSWSNSSRSRHTRFRTSTSLR
jgi:hypothetical protein